MKKTLLTILCALTALCGMAQTETIYNEQYVITYDGDVREPEQGQVTMVTQTDGSISFVLKNFVVKLDDGGEINIGDVGIDNLTTWEAEDGLTHFKGSRLFSIPKSALPASLKIAVTLGFADFSDIPINLEGKLNDEKLYAFMDLTIRKPETPITVEIGTDDFKTGVVVSKVYSNQLIVDVNGEISDPQDTDVTVVDNGDGTINFELKNFVLGAGEDKMYVGNIVIKNLDVTAGTDGYKHFTFNDNVNIQAGDYEADWMGPILGEIPLNLEGKMSDEKLYVTIDINLALLTQQIHVQLAYATKYTEPLRVTINGETPEPQTADVYVVDNGDGSINFLLKNFFLSADGDFIPVGNIYVENIATAEESGMTTFAYNGTLTIRNGSADLPEGSQWIGPDLGAIPVNLQGRISGNKLFVTIDIQEIFGQNVFVQLGPIPASYTEPYFITFYGSTSGERSTNVNIYDNDNNTIDFELDNLVVTVQELTIPVGTLTLHNLEAWDGEDGKTYFKGERTINIPADRLPEDQQYIAAMLKDIPVTINGNYDDTNVYAEFDMLLQVPGVGQATAHVQVGLAKGDVNRDTSVDIADVVRILSLMAQSAEAADYPEADVNEDGNIDIADVVKVLSIMASN